MKSKGSTTFEIKRSNPELNRLKRAGRTIALTVIALLLIVPCSFNNASASVENSPMAVTRSMVNAALGVLREKDMPVVQRRRKLREIIEPNFDFTEMSRSALGYHWRSITPAQRQQFTKLFTAFIEEAYLSKIQNYAGQEVDFVRQASLGKGYAEVDTRIIQNGKSPIPVSYLLEHKDGRWKVYDVTVDAISIIANYRNQFNRVVNNDGFNKLMADLQSKQEQLASLLGTGK